MSLPRLVTWVIVGGLAGGSGVARAARCPTPLTKAPPAAASFTIVYEPLVPNGRVPEAALRAKVDEFLSRDLRPWLEAEFPKWAGHVKITTLPLVNAVILEFPADAKVSTRRVKSFVRRPLYAVGRVHVVPNESAAPRFGRKVSRPTP